MSDLTTLNNERQRLAQAKSNLIEVAEMYPYLYPKINIMLNDLLRHEKDLHAKLGPALDRAEVERTTL